MPRLLGVEIPGEKRIEASLPYIYGLGPKTSKRILEQANIDPIFSQISSVSKRSVAIAVSGTFEGFRFAVSEPQPTRVREKARAKRSVFSGTKTLRPVKFKLDL